MLNPVGCPCMGAGPGAPPLAWSPTMPQPALHEAGSAAGSFFVPKEEEDQEGEGKVSVRSGGPATSRGPACMPNATGVAAATSSGPPAPPAAGRPLGRPPSPPPAARAWAGPPGRRVPEGRKEDACREAEGAVLRRRVARRPRAGPCAG
nr:classical arabinogalactan protein 5-like isoform X3 [Equus caballus]